MTHGDRQPYAAALLVLDPDGVAAWAERHRVDTDSIAELSSDARLLDAVADEVAQANAGLARAEEVNRWTVLPREWQADSDELTATMKLRRKSIAAKYAREIDQLSQTDVMITPGPRPAHDRSSPR